jgi:catechol 2,3-dioxygenase-like lactoylglutathione lyase family enzyme
MMLDHLVLATPDLSATSHWLAKMTGADPVPGGRHEAQGTRNLLWGLGTSSYLELIAPDGGVPTAGRRPFGLDERVAPGLASWCCRAELEAVADAAREVDLRVRGPVAMARRTDDDRLIRWRCLFVSEPAPQSNSVLPFFIEWGDTPHPCSSLPAGLRLERFALEHPDTQRVRVVLTALGLADVEVEHRPIARLRAVVAGPAGAVDLP